MSKRNDIIIKVGTTGTISRDGGAPRQYTAQVDTRCADWHSNRNGTVTATMINHGVCWAFTVATGDVEIVPHAVHVPWTEASAAHDKVHALMRRAMFGKTRAT